MAKVDVANKALDYLGEETILSFNDETEPARSVNIHYDASKRYLLTQHNWWFATVRKTLTADPAHSDEKYPYAYTLPTNCLKVLRIDTLGECWQRFGDQLWTTASAATIEYISEVDEAKWSAGFEEAYIYYLASKMAMKLTGDRALKGEAYQMYGQAILHAVATNDTEQGIQSFGNTDGQALRQGWYSLGNTSQG